MIIRRDPSTREPWRRPRPAQRGEVPERSNGSVSKTEVRATVPWVRIPPSPPVPFGVPLSDRPTAALSGRFPGVLGTDLLTGPARRPRKIALRRPFLSGPPDLADLVRSSSTQVKSRFQRGKHVPWFETRLLEISTFPAQTVSLSAAGPSDSGGVPTSGTRRRIPQFTWRSFRLSKHGSFATSSSPRCVVVRWGDVIAKP